MDDANNSRRGPLPTLAFNETKEQLIAIIHCLFSFVGFPKRKKKHTTLSKHEGASMNPIKWSEHTHLDEEVPSAQSCLPGHPALIHRLQVLQGWEGWSRGELLDWGVS